MVRVYDVPREAKLCSWAADARSAPCLASPVLGRGHARPPLERAVERAAVRKAEHIRDFVDGSAPIDDQALGSGGERFLGKLAVACLLILKATAQRSHAHAQVARRLAHVLPF